jgi:hypothetical protein
MGGRVPTYTGELTTAASPDVVFAYLAQWDNTVHWDPAVIAAAPVAGPPAVGAQFDLSVQLGRGVEVLRYEIVRYEPSHAVGFVADGRRFVSHDDFEITPTGSGSRVRATVRLQPKGVLRIATPFVGRALRGAGEAALEGLSRELARMGH